MEEHGDAGIDFAGVESLLQSLTIVGYEDAALAEARDESGRRTKVACWAHRGCEGLLGLVGPMEHECPHNRHDCYSPCPAECVYTSCVRPWHHRATDVALIFDTTVDRMAAAKKGCYMCEYFLKNGPRLGERPPEERVVPDTATREGSDGVTIHLF